jgi:hypothetical protein
LLILYMWYVSSVFMCFPFVCVFMMSMVSAMVPHLCPVFHMWLEYPELLLLFLIACMCSLYLVWKVLPVCPMYLSGQSKHFIWYMPLLLYLSFCGHCPTMFCIVFRVLNAIFILVSSNNCDFSCFFSNISECGPFLVLWVRVSVVFVVN